MRKISLQSLQNKPELVIECLKPCEATFILFYVLLAETAEDEGPKTDGGEAPKEGEDDKKRQKRGGKGLSKPKKKEGGPKKICLSVAPRGRKRLTVVTGLKSYGILILCVVNHMSYCIFFLSNLQRLI